MSGATSWYRWDAADLILQLHVQPRAGRDELAGLSPLGLRVRVTATPAEGQANQAVRGVLAEEFGVPKRDVVLERGESGRRKQVRIRSPRRIPEGLAVPKR